MLFLKKKRKDIEKTKHISSGIGLSMKVKKINVCAECGIVGWGGNVVLQVSMMVSVKNILKKDMIGGWEQLILPDLKDQLIIRIRYIYG
jgi:hypothetical protein|tara:strand:- start:355 stop:621 length:267 start_codon:yes stop_codon:yes gene_type:complete